MIIEQLKDITPSQKQDGTLEKITIKLQNRESGRQTKYFTLWGTEEEKNEFIEFIRRNWNLKKQ